MNDKKQSRPLVSRREFVSRSGAAGVVIAGATVAGAPFGRAGAADPVVEFVSTSCGADNAGGPKILVGYASISGSTGAVAETIGKELCKAGAQAEVKLIKEVADPSVYDAFVLGSAVVAGNWINDGTRFVVKHKNLLAQSPTALFITCMAMSEDVPASRKMAAGYVKRPLRLARKVKPVGMGTFAGAVDYSKMPKKYHSVMKQIVAEDCDYRNFEAISAWAQTVAPALTGK